MKTIYTLLLLATLAALTVSTKLRTKEQAAFGSTACKDKGIKSVNYTQKYCVPRIPQFSEGIFNFPQLSGISGNSDCDDTKNFAIVSYDGGAEIRCTTSDNLPNYGTFITSFFQSYLTSSAGCNCYLEGLRNAITLRVQVDPQNWGVFRIYPDQFSSIDTNFIKPKIQIHVAGVSRGLWEKNILDRSEIWTTDSRLNWQYLATVLALAGNFDSIIDIHPVTS